MNREWFGRGLYIETLESGTKVWRWKYRFNGKENRLSLGLVEYIPEALAIERREELRSILAKGVDPSQWRHDQQNFVILKG